MKRTFKIAALIILLAGAGLALYHFLTTPRAEGIATLTPAELQAYSELAAYSSPGVYAVEGEKPAELIDLPEGTNTPDSPLAFFALPFGKQTVMAACRNDQPDVYTVWLDTNLDRRLSDETPLSGESKERFNNPQHPWRYVDYGLLQIETDTFTSSPFRLTLALNGFYMEIQPTRCMKGKIRLGDDVYRIAAVDGDFDGQYKTLYEPSLSRSYHQCDIFTVDRPRGFSSSYDVTRLFPLGRYYRFNRERAGMIIPSFTNTEGYYSVDLSADGAQLKMQKVEPETGILKIGSEANLSVPLLSDAASQWIDFSNEISLPVGRYQVHAGWIAIGKIGEQHHMVANFTEDIRKGQFEIKPGETCTLNPGPPFTVRTDIRRNGRDTLSINAGLVGNEGETYGLRIVRDMPQPTLRILDENDAELHTGTMEYG